MHLRLLESNSLAMSPPAVLNRLGEPGEVLRDLNMTVKTINPQQNQLFILDQGTMLPKVSISYCKDSAGADHCTGLYEDSCVA